MLLVTGGNGFIGNRVRSVLREEFPERKVAFLDHRWSGPDELRSVLPAAVDACIHLAWTASAPDYLTNVTTNAASLDASLELAGALAERSCRHLVVTGTCAEYGPQDRPLGEAAMLAPDTVYGRDKVRLLESLHGFGIPFAWTRLFHVTGPGESMRRIIPFVADQLLSDTAIELSPGNQVRDFIDADDVARALLAVSDRKVVGELNVCRGQPTRLGDMLLRVADALEADPALLRFGARPYGEHDPMFVVGDPLRIRAMLPEWAPRYDDEQIALRVAQHWTARHRDGQRV